MDPLTGGSALVTPVSHVVFALAAVALLGFELRRLRRARPIGEEDGDDHRGVSRGGRRSVAGP